MIRTQISLDKIEYELHLNLTGVMLFADPLIKAMAARGSGNVVFISSVNAIAHFTDWIVAHVHVGGLGWNHSCVGGPSP